MIKQNTYTTLLRNRIPYNLIHWKTLAELWLEMERIVISQIIFDSLTSVKLRSLKVKDQTLEGENNYLNAD
jgi:hypothetical protein